MHTTQPGNWVPSALCSFTYTLSPPQIVLVYTAPSHRCSDTSGRTYYKYVRMPSSEALLHLAADLSTDANYAHRVRHTKHAYMDNWQCVGRQKACLPAHCQLIEDRSRLPHEQR